MRKSELDRMMDRAKEMSADEDPTRELLSMLVIMCGEQLLQMAEIKRGLADLAPKVNTVALAMSEMEDKISGKLALTRYDIEDGED